MPLSPNDFYRELLTHPTPITAAVQMRIFSWAKAHSEFATLALLQHRADLTPTIDDLLSKIDNPVVKAAHVCRPGRSNETLSMMAKKDRRVAVQGVLASHASLDDEAYAVMAKSTSRKVLFPLVANLAAPLSSRVAAMRLLAFHVDSGSYAEKHTYYALLAYHPELTAEAIDAIAAKLPARDAQLAQSYLFTGLFGRAQSNGADPIGTFLPATVTQLADMLVTALLRTVANAMSQNAAHRTYSYFHQASILLDQMGVLAGHSTLGAPARKRMARAITDASQAVESASGPGNPNSMGILGKATQILGMLDATFVPELNALTSTRDMQVLLEAAHRVDPQGPTAQNMAGVIATNPTTTPAVMVALCDRMGAHAVWLAAGARVTKVDVRAELLAANPYCITDQTLANCDDPKALVLELLQRDCSAFAERLASSKYMDPADVGLLPTSWLGTFGTGSAGAEPLRLAAVSYIVTTLEDDPAAWEMFEGFAPQIPGTIDQLLDQIRRLNRRPA